MEKFLSCLQHHYDVIQNSSSPHLKCFHQCLVFVEQCAGLVGAAGHERVTFSLRGQFSLLHHNTCI